MIKKKHHYLSRFYLEGFCDQNAKIWTYPKANSNNPFARTPEKTAITNKLYHLDLDGVDKKYTIDTIEDYLADEIEGPAASSFKMLREKIFPNVDEKLKLSKFFGTLFSRTPRQIEHLKNLLDNDIEKYSLLLASNKDHYHNSWNEFDPSLSTFEIEQNRLLVLNGKIKMGAHTNFILDKMILSGLMIGELLNNMNWAILETCETQPFITSDNLINVSHPHIPPTSFYQPGFGMPDVRVIIPISKKLCLLLVNNHSFSDKSIQAVDNAVVTELNKLIYFLSNKFLFASTNSEELRTFFSACAAELN